ncbi:MAG: hypothetical protein Q7R82_00795 [Candidatus Daviesbacteria bacterium]|nr:hypothetical protein [Candidatus Daviesbacteria bacterium]
MRIAFPKKIGWILITLLVFWDVLLTYLGGSEGNPLWKPIVQTYGINALWVLAPVALLIFYLATKILGWLIKTIDKIAEGEEIVLTGLVLVFATYDLYITFFLRSFGWMGSRSHYSIILLLMVPVIGYIIYTEIVRRKNK